MSRPIAPTNSRENGEYIVRIIHLDRVDEGRVAEGIEFTDGRVVLKWLSGVQSFEVYDNIADLRAIRELSGRSRVVVTELTVTQ